MAMIDYGAVAFKNGKLISTDMFTPMINMVGWEDTVEDTYHNYDKDTDEPLKLNGNFFAYVGDRDCTLAFYKGSIVIVRRYQDDSFDYHREYFNCTNYTWSKWEGDVYFYDDTTRPVVTKRNGYYVCKWRYKGDKYKVYFGYGVDLHCYKKCRLINYYRSPQYMLTRLKRNLAEWRLNLWRLIHQK